MKKVWEELLQNDDFKQILNTIVNTNKNAISQ
jgi:hypothetical protein